MDDYFASVNASNSKILCVGGITRTEAEAAASDGLDVDGRGYYLFLADERSPGQPIQILAKFISALEAEQACKALLRQAAA